MGHHLADAAESADLLFRELFEALQDLQAINKIIVSRQDGVVRAYKWALPSRITRYYYYKQKVLDLPPHPQKYGLMPCKGVSLSGNTFTKSMKAPQAKILGFKIIGDIEIVITNLEKQYLKRN